jgi:hypothetical protein
VGGRDRDTETEAAEREIVRERGREKQEKRGEDREKLGFTD